MNEHRSSCIIHADHPCLTGHFPGHPIVPGVIVLERVVQAAEAWLGQSLTVQKFSNVKFLRPLKPDEPMEIVLSGELPLLRFRCECNGHALAQGVFET